VESFHHKISEECGQCEINKQMKHFVYQIYLYYFYLIVNNKNLHI